MTPDLLPDTATGEECAEALRRAARERCEPLQLFLAPLWGGQGASIQSRLQQLSCAARPTPQTLARIRAILAGGEVPPARTYQRSGVDTVRESCAAEARAHEQRLVLARSTGSVVRPLDTFGGRPVLHQPAAAHDSRPRAASREPCPRCNTRGDLGCRHFAPMELRHG